MPPSSRKPLIWVGTLCATLLVVTAATWFALRVERAANTLVRSPTTALGPTEIYDDLVSPAVDRRNPLDPKFRLSDLSLEITDDPKDGERRRAVFTFFPSEEPDYRRIVSPVATAPDLSAALPDEKSGRVDWLAARCPTEADLKADGDGYQLGVFSPDLRPLAPEHPSYPDRWDLSADNEAEKAQTGFAFQISLDGFEDVLWRLRWFYDRRTKSALASGYGYTSSGAECRASTDLHCVHPADVRAIIDVFHGPVETVELDAVEGARADLANAFHVSLAPLLPGTSSRHGSSGAYRDEPARLTLHPAIATEATHTTVALAFSPANAPEAVTVEAIDRDGNAHRSSGSTANKDGLRVTSFEVPAGELATFRISYRPHVFRLLVDFPPLPGTPPENANPDDLFDVVIPYLVVEDEDDLRYAIARTVQLTPRSTVRHAPPPPGSYPRSYANVTSRQLVADYLSVHSGLAIVATADGQLNFQEPPPPLRWPDRIKRWWQSLF